jgi:hypothetical protein
MKDPPSDGKTLVMRRPERPNLFDDVALQKLWLATQRREWRSLAVVAGSKGVPTVDVANMLAKIAWWYRGEPTCVFDLRELSLRLVEHQIQEITEQVDQGGRVIIALKSIFENPTAIAVAEIADASVLCLRLGKSSMSQAEQTLEEIGRGRFIGSIIVNPKKKATGADGEGG